MIKARNLGAAAISTLIVSSCSQLPNSPLIFGQTHTVGITIAGSPVEQGGEFTLGYRDRDLAIIPVTVTQGDGTVTQLDANVFGDERSETAQPDKDAFAVLGQFELNAEGQQANVGLGKFFATGLAARRLADGFADAMSEDVERENAGTGDGS